MPSPAKVRPLRADNLVTLPVTTQPAAPTPSRQASPPRPQAVHDSEFPLNKTAAAPLTGGAEFHLSHGSRLRRRRCTAASFEQIDRLVLASPTYSSANHLQECQQRGFRRESHRLRRGPHM